MIFWCNRPGRSLVPNVYISRWTKQKHHWFVWTFGSCRLFSISIFASSCQLQTGSHCRNTVYLFQEKMFQPGVHQPSSKIIQQSKFYLARLCSLDCPLLFCFILHEALCHSGSISGAECHACLMSLTQIVFILSLFLLFLCLDWGFSLNLLDALCRSAVRLPVWLDPLCAVWCGCG